MLMAGNYGLLHSEPLVQRHALVLGIRTAGNGDVGALISLSEAHSVTLTFI